MTLILRTASGERSLTALESLAHERRAKHAAYEHHACQRVNTRKPPTRYEVEARQAFDRADRELFAALRREHPTESDGEISERWYQLTTWVDRNIRSIEHRELGLLGGEPALRLGAHPGAQGQKDTHARETPRAGGSVRFTTEQTEPMAQRSA